MYKGKLKLTFEVDVEFPVVGQRHPHWINREAEKWAEARIINYFEQPYMRRGIELETEILNLEVKEEMS